MSKNNASVTDSATGRTRFLQYLFILCIALPRTCAWASDNIYVKNQTEESIFSFYLKGAEATLGKNNLDVGFQKGARSLVGNNFEFTIDDYLQYAPIAELYTSDILKVESRNHWFSQTKYLLISIGITSAIANSLKYITNATRPNGAVRSFPSGHTTFAFTNATVLFNEFRQSSPMLAYSGYAFAAATGLFRILNNKHWLTDVLAGAAIGVAVTDWVYYIEPFKSFNPFNGKKKIMLAPILSNNEYGFLLGYRF